MGKSRTFLVPVCVDDTSEADADIPDSFAAVQRTRLPGGDTPPGFVEQIRQMLMPAEGRATTSHPSAWTLVVRSTAIIHYECPSPSGGSSTLLAMAVSGYNLDRQNNQSAAQRPQIYRGE
jgi:hypothetical protein